MYCIYCGKKLQEGEVCNCKNPEPVKPEATYESPVAPVIEETPVYDNTPVFESAPVFEEAPAFESAPVTEEAPVQPATALVMKGRKLAGSWLVFTVAALLLSSLVLSFFIPKSNLITTLMLVAFSLTTCLMLVAFSLTACFAVTGNKTKGVTFISGILIAYIVLICVSFASIFAMAFVAYGIPANDIDFIDSSTLNDYRGIPLAVMIIIWVFAICLFAFVLAAFVGMRNNVLAVRNALNDNLPVRHVRMFPAIVLFINAFISLGTMTIALILPKWLSDGVSSEVSSFTESLGYKIEFNFHYSSVEIIICIIQILVPVLLGLLNIKVYKAFTNSNNAE